MPTWSIQQLYRYAVVSLSATWDGTPNARLLGFSPIAKLKDAANISKWGKLRKELAQLRPRSPEGHPDSVITDRRLVGGTLDCSVSLVRVSSNCFVVALGFHEVGRIRFSALTSSVRRKALPCCE